MDKLIHINLKATYIEIFNRSLTVFMTNSCGMKGIKTLWGAGENKHISLFFFYFLPAKSITVMNMKCHNLVISFVHFILINDENQYKKKDTSCPVRIKV